MEHVGEWEKRWGPFGSKGLLFLEGNFLSFCGKTISYSDGTAAVVAEAKTSAPVTRASHRVCVALGLEQRCRPAPLAGMVPGWASPGSGAKRRVGCRSGFPLAAVS